MKIEIINPLNYKNWDDLLISNPNYSFFYTSFWAKVLCESYKYNPLYFSIIQNNRLLALIPILEIKSIITGKRGVSLPFSDYCEPLVIDESNFLEIMGFVSKYGREAGWNFIKLRGGDNYTRDQNPIKSYYLHTLNFAKNEEEMFKNLKYNLRYDIKKAIKDGVCIEICNTFAAVKEFYQLNCLTRKRHGVPPQPFNFFKNLYKYIISKDQGLIINAIYKNRCIASAIFFHFGEKAIYKYSASDIRYKRVNASKLVMWEAMKWYIQRNYKFLSFGRTDPENKGLLQFKGGWGGSVQKIGYYIFNIKNKDKEIIEKPNAMKLINIIIRRLPMPIFKLIGFLFYKHAG